MALAQDQWSVSCTQDNFFSVAMAINDAELSTLCQFVVPCQDESAHHLVTDDWLSTYVTKTTPVRDEIPGLVDTLSKLAGQAKNPNLPPWLQSAKTAFVHNY
eukprot:TRINITY_DN5839_c0_g1_i1.p1 TRINITY_DN5839_c0_g1~~TRINITY_DN5839_c0_g1_i1.p1  ORF type:complete len:102 (+),score=12.33 TRINITY_DN5839_c0_g1_i1:238-543(+)